MDPSNVTPMHPLSFIHNDASREESSPVSTSLPSDRDEHDKQFGGVSTSVKAASVLKDDHDFSARLNASPSIRPGDVENQDSAASLGEDPYNLSSKIKTMSEMISIRRSISQKKTLGPFAINKQAANARKVQSFYKEQNKTIERLLKPVSEHRREAKSEKKANALRYQIAVYASLAANACLAILQVFGAAASGSLSLFTTMADALFDPLSNLMLLFAHRAVNRVDPQKFPSGKARIETAGNIVFCFLMCSVSFILIVMSIREIAEGSESETKPFHIPSMIAVSVAFGTKLFLFSYCYPLRIKFSQVRILWEDHRNDIIVNGLGIVTSILGSKVKWWIDPMGAIILSCLVAFLWLRTAYSEFRLLVGVSADTHTLQLLTYISMTHSEAIRAIDTVRAWHSGPRFVVEVDVVMDAEQSLKATHNVAEDLQIKLESLPNVDRAYVHVDFETSHAPEHFFKKEL